MRQTTDESNLFSFTVDTPPRQRSRTLLVAYESRWQAIPSLVSQSFEFKDLIAATPYFLQALLPNSEHEVVHLNRETRGAISFTAGSQSLTKLPHFPQRCPCRLFCRKIHFSVGNCSTTGLWTDCTRTHRHRNPQRSRLLSTGKQVQATACTCCQSLVDSTDWTSGQTVPYATGVAQRLFPARPSCDGEVKGHVGPDTRLREPSGNDRR